MSILLGAFANPVLFSFWFHWAAGFVKSDRVHATTWPSLISLFRQGFAYLIYLVPGSFPCLSPAFSTALSVASYLYGINVIWTYG